MIRGGSSMALVLTLAILSVVVVAELRYDVGSRGISGSARQGSASHLEAVSPPFVLSDREELSDTLARPLFMPNRLRPDETPVETPAEAPRVSRPTTNRYVLSAIVIVDDERIALMTDTSTGTLLRVREGERVAGWQVERILEDGAVLTSGDAREELSLRSFGPPAPVQRGHRRRAVPRESVTPGRAREDDAPRPPSPPRQPSRESRQDRKV